MKQLKMLIDLLIYGNFWIALGALCMGFQSSLIFTETIPFNALNGFIFFATLFLYAAHRIIGMEEAAPFRKKGRFQIIFKYKRQIILYGFIAGIISLVLFFYLSRQVQLLLLPAAIVSLAYVIPFFKKNKRLRDMNYIKIFLIAVSWAWITVILPASEAEMINQSSTWIMLGERFLFILVITLPFDIRDLKIDTYSKVKTLPALLGLKKTKILMALLMLLISLLIWWNFESAFYSKEVFLALMLSITSTYPILHFASPSKHDYYFSGLIDGTIVVQFLLVWGLFVFFMLK